MSDLGDDNTFVDIDPLSDPEERRVLFAALDSYRQYRRAAHYNITHIRRQSFHALPQAHVEILSNPPFSLQRTFQAVDDAIDANADIAEAVLALGLETYGIDPDDDDWKGQATPEDMDKARSTIRQLYRDWSEEGQPERDACFGPMLDALDDYLQSWDHPEEASVLVPGAGLGRLLFDICLRGYSAQGNEISYHQLLMSNWILNRQPAARVHPMYPWALSFSNHSSRENQLQKVLLPDIAPAAALIEADRSMERGKHAFERMSMASGDFTVLYGKTAGVANAGAFDAVMTCFFIDTAPNLMAYIETVKHCLVPGGRWINMGPLLWHFDGASGKDKRAEADSTRGNLGIGESGSFELTEEEVLQLLKSQGFRPIEHDSHSYKSGYIQDPRGMLQNTYRNSFWVVEADPEMEGY